MSPQTDSGPLRERCVQVHCWGPLGQSRGQTQAVDRVYSRPKTDSEPQCRESGRVGRWDRDAPPTGKGQPQLVPLPLHWVCENAAGLGFESWEDSPARGWGSGMVESKWLGSVQGSIALPPVLSLAGSSSASEGPQASPQTGVPAVYVPGAPGIPAPCHPQWAQQQGPHPGGQAQQALHPWYHASGARPPHSHVKAPVQAGTQTHMPMWMCSTVLSLTHTHTCTQGHTLVHATDHTLSHDNTYTPMCKHLHTQTHAHANGQAPV